MSSRLNLNLIIVGTIQLIAGAAISGTPVPLAAYSTHKSSQSSNALPPASHTTWLPGGTDVTAATQAGRSEDSDASKVVTLDRYYNQFERVERRHTEELVRRGRFDGNWLPEVADAIEAETPRAAVVPHEDVPLRTLSPTQQGRADDQPSGRLRHLPTLGLKANAKFGLTSDRLNVLYSNNRDRFKRSLKALTISIMNAHKKHEKAVSLGDHERIAAAKTKLDADSAAREALWRVMDGTMAPEMAERHAEDLFDRLRGEAVPEPLISAGNGGTSSRRRPRSNQKEWHKSPFFAPDLLDELNSTVLKIRRNARDKIRKREKSALRRLAEPARLMAPNSMAPHSSSYANDATAGTALSTLHVYRLTGQPVYAARRPPADLPPVHSARAESDLSAPLRTPPVLYHAPPATDLIHPAPALDSSHFNDHGVANPATHLPSSLPSSQSVREQLQPHSPSSSNDSAAMFAKYLKELEHHASTASSVQVTQPEAR